MKHHEDQNLHAEDQQPVQEDGAHERKTYVAPTLRTLSTRETRIGGGITITDGITTS